MTRLDFNIAEDVRDKYVNARNNYSGPHIYINEFNPLISTFGHSTILDMMEVALEETNKYKDMLKDGLYEFFQDKWAEVFGEEITRNQIKKEWMKYVFSQKGIPFNFRMEAIWEREFPLLTKVLEHFKKGDYRFLAQELQRKESNIMFKDLCPSIDAMNIEYFTVHDSIVVKESEVERVNKKFKEVLYRNNVMTGVAV